MKLVEGEKPHVIYGNKRTRARDEVSCAIAVPEANAELQPNLDRLRMMSDTKAKSKSDKFPPPHQDAAVGDPLDASRNRPVSFSAADTSFRSPQSLIGGLHDLYEASHQKVELRGVGTRNDKEEPQRAPARSFMNVLYPSSIVWDFGFSRRRTGLENGRDRR